MNYIPLIIAAAAQLTLALASLVTAIKSKHELSENTKTTNATKALVNGTARQAAEDYARATQEIVQLRVQVKELQTNLAGVLAVRKANVQ